MIRVSDLTVAEKRVWDAYSEGREVDFRVGDPAEDDPARGPDWGPERVLRAEVLRALLLDVKKPVPGAMAALRVTGARVVGPLVLDYVDVRNPVRLVDCSFAEAFSFFGARTRRMNLSRSHFVGIGASHATVAGSLLLNGIRLIGAAHLVGTHVAGALHLEGAELSNPGGDALHGNRLRVDDDLLMTGGFSAAGTIALRGAYVGGELSMNDARLIAPGGLSVHASRLEVAGDLRCERVESTGEFRMAGATIAGIVRLTGATLSAPDGEALYLYQTRVGANIQCNEGFSAVGAVRLPGVHVAGNVDFGGATLSAPGALALDANTADISGHFLCNKGFRSTGRIRLDGIRVGASLTFHDADIDASSSPPPTGVLLDFAKAGELDFRTAQPAPGVISFSHAAVGMLTDDPRSWPADIRLDGFEYRSFKTAGPVAQRLAWLGRDPGGYQPQPYEQLASVYRTMGHEGDARRVLLAKHRARRRTLTPAARAWGLVQDAAVGYGYRPERALGWLSTFLIAGTAIFAMHRPVPNGTAPGTPFNPFIYSLDLLLPIINLGQSKAFVATAGYQWPAYLLTTAGWILSATIAAAVARAVNRT